MSQQVGIRGNIGAGAALRVTLAPRFCRVGRLRCEPPIAFRLLKQLAVPSTSVYAERGYDFQRNFTAVQLVMEGWKNGGEAGMFVGGFTLRRREREE